jgi:hypothetical protein
MLQVRRLFTATSRAYGHRHQRTPWLAAREDTVTDKPLSWTGCIREDFWPGIFDSIETWEQWLAEVLAMPDFPMKDYFIESAKRVIEQNRQYLRAKRYGVDWVH